MSLVNIKVKGKNIERFIKRLNSLNINLYNIEYIKYNEIIIKINESDLDKVIESKTIYDLEIINYTGLKKYINKFQQNKLVILLIIVSFLFIIYLSNTIFNIEVIHSDAKVRELIINELKENDIKVYSSVKDYNYITKVKKKILEKYKDKIEWLEIERNGTKYIVKIIMKKQNSKKDTLKPRDIIAKKNALIIKVEATNGEIIKNKNDYVRKGDTIITGEIKLYDEIKNIVPATGKVYGEIWYKVTVEYPLNYIENKVTSKTKKVYSLKFLNKKISLYNNYYVTKEEIIYKNKVIPFMIIKETKKKIKKIRQTLTKEEAINKAILKATDKINSQLNDNEYIIDTKKLKVETNNSKIILELFFSVCEDITDYKEIGDINV